MARSFLVKAAFFAVGAGLGLLLRAVRWEGGPAGGELGPPLEEAPALSKGDAEIPRGSPDLEEAPEPRSLESKTPALDLVRHIIDCVPEQPMPEGPGAISGAVVTDRGDALPGVRVRLKPTREMRRGARDLGWEPFPGGSLEARACGYLANAMWERGRTRETVTADAGTFQFEGLPEGSEYFISAVLDGWAIAPFQGMRSRVRPGDRVRFLAREAGRESPSLEVSFVFLLPDGSEIEEGTLETQSPGGAWRSSWWQRSRPVSFGRGVHIVRASAQVGGETYRSAPVAVAVPRAERNPIVLELRSAPGIYGEIRLPPGSALEEVPVSAKWVRRGEGHPSLDSLRWSVLANLKNGFRYSLADLAPGLYYVAAAWGPGGPIAAEAFVEVGEEKVRQDLELRSPDAGSGFIIRGYGPGGGPVSFYAWLETYRRNGDRALSGNRIDLQRTLGEDGAPRFFPARALDSVDTRETEGWVLVIIAPPYGWLRRPFDPWREREVEVRFEEPASLAVTIEGYRESKYPRGEVAFRLFATLEAPDGPVEYDSVDWKQPDGEGRAHFWAKQPGLYVLRAEFEVGPEDFQRSRDVYRSTVDLRSGPNEIAVRLAPLYDLVVRCPGAGEGDRLVLCQEAAVSGWSAVLGSERTAVFPGIPEGTYTLRLEGPRGGEMDVAAPGPEEVEFRPEPFNALRMHWPREGAYAREVGLSVFDQIVGVGHELFQDPGDLARILEASADQEEIYLLVQNWRGRRAVPVNPKKFLGDMGRTFLLVPVKRR